MRARWCDLFETSAHVVEVPGDYSDDSDAEQWAHFDIRVGDVDVIRKCLDGIGAHSEDNGARGLGRHATTIRIGRDLWQSQPLSASEEDRIEEDVFPNLPAAKDLKKDVAQIKKSDDVRPELFSGKTLPLAHLSVVHYGKLIQAWFDTVAAEAEPPNEKQWEVLRAVRQRVSTEFRLFKEGPDSRQCGSTSDTDEEPLRGFIHGPLGAGRSRLIR